MNVLREACVALNIRSIPPRPITVPTDLFPRLLAGGILASVVASFAVWRGRLTAFAACAAAVVGIAAAIGGARWVLALLVFFFSSVLLSEWRSGEKRRRSQGILANDRARNVRQVIANGGLFAYGAVGWGLIASPRAELFGFGALAAAAADTWATEVGMAFAATPVLLLTGRPAPPGTSGAVSAPGSAAALGGALVVALCGSLSATQTLDLPHLAAIFAGGVSGAVADSLLGAAAQSRRWCTRCSAWTERRVHVCGTLTEHRRGMAWMDNDMVNLLATAVGGMTAIAVGRT